MKKKVLCAISIIIILIQNTCLAVYVNENDNQDENLNQILETASVVDENEPKLNVRNAVVYDRKSNRVIFGKQENKRVAMASTTNIVTT